MKKFLLLGVAFIIAPAFAQEAGLPKKAVSEMNVKTDLGGGISGGNSNYGGGATFTAPLGDKFGGQIDVGAAKNHGSEQYGVAGHLFYRDPTAYMFGVTAMGVEIERRTFTRYGLETEFYLGRFSVLPSAGYQQLAGNESVYGTLQVAYYPKDNILLGIGGTGYGSVKSYGVSGEYQFEGTKTSLYTDLGVSNHEAGYVMAGVRMSFGGKGKGLMERDRYDDPPNIVRYLNTTSGSGLHNQVTKAKETSAVVAGGGCCFIAGTMILMASGALKRIEEIVVGDKVMGVDGVINEVNELIQPILGSRKLYALNDENYFVTAEHPFLAVDGSWKAIDPEATAREHVALPVTKLEVGDILRTKESQVEVAMIKSRSDKPEIVVYNLSLLGNNTYFANGYAVHNKGE